MARTSTQSRRRDAVADAPPAKCADCGGVPAVVTVQRLAPASGRLAGVTLCAACNYAASARLLARAAAEGRHAPAAAEICGGCGRRVPALHHVRLDGVYVCQPCAVNECKCPGCRAERARREEAGRGA
jgi:hypothetical protein